MGSHPLSSLYINKFTGIDYVGYALGQTDTFQGTGVFSGIKIQREEPNESASPAQPKEGMDAKKLDASAKVEGMETSVKK